MVASRRSQLRFEGRIAGWGTASGTRIIVGAWHRSPLGAFADVMVERPDGERLLLAPTAEVAEFVGSTYRFDTTMLCPVTVQRVTAGGPAPLGAAATGTGQVWELSAGTLWARLVIGGRPPLGHVLRLVPPALSGAPLLTYVTDPLARLLLRGVRTRGSAGGGRTEYYGARDLHRLVEVRTRWAGENLGPVRPLHPPVTFGFGSAPPRASVTDLVTTVRSRR